MGSPGHLEYIYNTNNNRLSEIYELGETYTYNNRGDLLTATGGYTFAYDREGRLEKLKESSGGLIHKFTFLYSPQGRRIMKIDSSDAEVDTTYYIYDGMNAVAELDGSLDLKSKYIYTNGMLMGRIDSDDELFQYFHDGLGSITMITDTTGSYQNLYVYDDFGNFRHKVENVSNSYYYTGQERDEEPSGLYNLRNRYYSSNLGRFTQLDPIVGLLVVGNMQELTNGYTYVANNPMMFVDPWGLRGEDSNWWAEWTKDKHLIVCVDVGLQGAVPILGIFGPWGGIGFTIFFDPAAQGPWNAIGFGPNYKYLVAGGVEFDIGCNVGLMYGKNIRSAKGLGYTAGGSGALLHGGGLNVSISADKQTVCVDFGYNFGIAGEIHGGKIIYPVIWIPGSD